MVSELTGDYKLLLPSMWVCAIAFLVGRRWSIYRSQVASRIDSPAHFGEFAMDMLSKASVSQVYKSRRKYQLIPQDMTVAEIFAMVANSSQRIFPVVDETSRVVGLFRLNDLNLALQRSNGSKKTLRAKDLIVPEIRTTRPSDSVQDALRLMNSLNVDELLVTADEDPRLVVGIVTNADILLYYSQEISRLKLEEQDHPPQPAPE